jgi:hypothetical protein
MVKFIPLVVLPFPLAAQSGASANNVDSGFSLPELLDELFLD